ncbi:MAG: 3-oxoacyl-ACP reductase [Actinobacteria bacterium]|nr:MAG: 3-oxoacyl-ACP reductase [Actinomycetota bacterium]
MSATGDVIARGNVAVITGGASGIGLAMAERFIAEGMSVLLADIDEPKLRNVEARLTEAGADVATQICNTSSEIAVAELAEFAIERFGAVHVLCNNAGIAGVGDAWIDSMELWDRVIGVNLYGVIHGVRSFLPIMQQQGLGHIVNTASIAGLIAVPGAAPYNVTKHGVVALSEGLFIELGLTGSSVGVSVLCPGFVKTDLMEKEPDRVESPIGEFMNEMIRTGVETGVDASGIADQVADAINGGHFWILTHPDTRPLAVERMERAAALTNPTLPGEG